VPEASCHDVLIHYETVRWNLAAPGVPVLLHTGAGGDLGMWREGGYVRGLAPRRLILMDHRGHGGSARPRDPAEHTIDRYVTDVACAMDAEGVERVAFLGYSDGAAVGYAFAAAHPDRTAAVIGLGAVGDADEPMSERRDLAAAVRDTGMDGLVADLAAAEPGAVPDWFVDQMRATDPEMFALELEGWASWAGPWATFASIDAPTIIIVGEVEEGEPGVAGIHAAGAAARLPRGASHVVPGVGHVGVFLRSELTLPVISRFLDGA
jgi:pimeloyl-ACP methyl ester carboxylesterase